MAVVRSEFPSIESPGFQTFINNHFRQYKLEPDNSDPCAKKENKAYPYQLFVAEYLKNYPGLLLCWGLGSGKTNSAILVRQALSRRTYVLLPASLKPNFMHEVLKYYKVNGRPVKDPDTFGKFISYNAGNTTVDALNLADFNNSLVIVDEVQNIVSLMMSQESKTGELLLKKFREAENLKVLFLSGTPMVNSSFEIAVIANIIARKKIFPYSEKKFNTLSDGVIRHKLKGLISYYRGAGTLAYAWKKEIPTVEVVMSDYQFERYLKARKHEIKRECLNSLLARKGQVQPFVRNIKAVDRQRVLRDYTMEELFKVKSRQYTDFVFPERVEQLFPQTQDEISDDTLIGETDSQKKATKARHQKMIQKVNALSQDELENLAVYGPKLLAVYNQVIKSPGPVFIYSNWLTGHGLHVLAKFFDLKGIKYVLWTGEITDPQRKKIMEQFNDPRNIKGERIKAFMATKAGAEGISLMNIRQVHVLQPHWNDARINQVIGRAIRICSHAGLDRKDQVVDIYRYVAKMNTQQLKMFIGEIPDKFLFPVVKTGTYENKVVYPINNGNYRIYRTEIVIQPERIKNESVLILPGSRERTPDQILLDYSKKKQIGIDKILHFIRLEAVDRYLNEAVNGPISEPTKYRRAPSISPNYRFNKQVRKSDDQRRNLDVTVKSPPKGVSSRKANSL